MITISLPQISNDIRVLSRYLNQNTPEANNYITTKSQSILMLSSALGTTFALKDLHNLNYNTLATALWVIAIHEFSEAQAMTLVGQKCRTESQEMMALFENLYRLTPSLTWQTFITNLGFPPHTQLTPPRLISRPIQNPTRAVQQINTGGYNGAGFIG